MIDIKKLRDDAKNTQNSLLKRGYKLNIEEFISLDSARKDLQISVEDLQSQRKELSAEFGKLKSSGGHTGNLKEEIDAINANLKSKDDILQNLLGSINNFMLDIPNIPREDVPVGSSEIDNIVVSKYGQIKTKTSPDHLSITSDIDTDSAANIAGSRFSVLKGDLSKLQRSLIHFMLEVATKNGY